MKDPTPLVPLAITLSVALSLANLCLAASSPGAGIGALVFEQNQGQYSSEVRFEAVYPLAVDPDGSRISIISDGVRFMAGGSTITLQFDGASDPSGWRFTGRDKKRGTVSYFPSSDPATWTRAAGLYGSVEIAGIYRGITLVIRSDAKGRQPEYDWRIDPGADPNRVRMRFIGASKIEVQKTDGSLLVEGGPILMRHRRPHMWQEGGGEVSGGFRKQAGTRVVGFAISSYDRKRTLVVDPIIEWMRFFGGGEYCYATLDPAASFSRCYGEYTMLAVGKDDSVYLGGNSFRKDYQTSLDPNAVLPSLRGRTSYVAKVDSEFNELVYAAYFGAAGVSAMLPDAEGNLYIAGGGSRVPEVKPPLPIGRPEFGGGLYVAKINVDATQVLFSTVFGGSSLDETVTTLAFADAGRLVLVAVNLNGNELDRFSTLPEGAGLHRVRLPVHNSLLFAFDASKFELRGATYWYGGAAGMVEASNGAGGMSTCMAATSKPNPPPLSGGSPLKLEDYQGDALDDRTEWAFVTCFEPDGRERFTHLIGRGAVRSMVALPEGGVLVSGKFSLPGEVSPGSSLVEMSTSGELLRRLLVGVPSDPLTGKLQLIAGKRAGLLVEADEILGKRATPGLRSTQPDFGVCNARGYLDCLHSRLAEFNRITGEVISIGWVGAQGSEVRGFGVDSQGRMLVSAYTGEMRFSIPEDPPLLIGGEPRGTGVLIRYYASDADVPLPPLVYERDIVYGSSPSSVGLPFWAGVARLTGRHILETPGDCVAQVPLPTELCGVTVRVDGRACPIVSIEDLGEAQTVSFQNCTLNVYPGIIEVFRGPVRCVLQQPPNPSRPAFAVREPHLGPSPQPSTVFLKEADGSEVSESNRAKVGETLIGFLGSYWTNWFESSTRIPLGTPPDSPVELSRSSSPILLWRNSQSLTFIENTYPESVTVLAGCGGVPEALRPSYDLNCLGYYRVRFRVPASVTGLSEVTLRLSSIVNFTIPLLTP